MHGVQWVVQFESASQLIPRGQEHVVGDSRSHLVGHGPRGLISDPAMNTSSAREHPEHGLEPKVVGECIVEHHGGARHVGPALAADLGALAARAHVVVVGHVDIEDHLLSHRHENLFLRGQVVLRRHVEHSTDIDLVWGAGNQRFFELLGRLEAEVAAVDVVFEGEGKLTVVEELRFDLVVTQTLELVLLV